jgi:hypothetical protein
MFEFFIAQINRRVDVDFTQSMINCFLKAHYDTIMEDEDLAT